MKRFFISVAVLVCAFLAPPWAQARVLKLYTEKGNQVANYNAVIRNVRPGDTLDMGDGRTFVVSRRLGHGNTTQIFETEDLRALRVPRARGHFIGFDYRDFLEMYVQGHQSLGETELPIPKLYLEDSNPRRYLVVERVKEVHFGLHDFLNKKPAALGLTEAEYKRIDAELDDFAKHSWEFRGIEDAHSDQVVHTNRGWMLLDFNRGVQRAHVSSAGGQPTMFNSHFMTDYISSAREKARLHELSEDALAERRRHLPAISCPEGFEGLTR